MNWWDPDNEGLCVWSAYQPVGAGSFASSLLDLTGTGRDAVDPGGAATPGWNAGAGWVFDGIADYLTTTFVPANDQSQGFLVQFTGGAGPINRAIFGTDDGGGSQFEILPNAVGPIVRYRNGGNVSVAVGLVAGNLGIAGNQGYRNGVADGGAIPAWGAAVSACFIGCENQGGVPAIFYQCNIQALAVYDCVLTAPQMLAVMTAMAAL